MTVCAQTCVSVTLGNLSSLTLQQEMIMPIQTGGSALTCIPSLRGHSRSAASLGLITQPTLCECNRSGLVSLKFPFAHSGWHYRCSVTLATPVVLNLFTPADRQNSQKKFADRQHTIAVNGPGYHNHFVSQSYGFISRILIFRTII